MYNTPLITLNMCNKKKNNVTTCEYKLMSFTCTKCWKLIHRFKR